MRILIFSKSMSFIEINKDSTYLKKSLKTQIDFFNDIENTDYCSDIRDYDVIFIEYLFEYHKKYYNIFGASKNKDIKPEMFLFGKNLNRANSIFEFFPDVKRVDQEKIDLKFLINESIPTAAKKFKVNGISVDIDKKTFTIKHKDGDKVVHFEREFEFLVTLYFIRHYGTVLRVSSLIGATCEEPEEKKDSVIEASISKIRKQFVCSAGVNPIKSLKKVGYRFSLDEEAQNK